MSTLSSANFTDCDVLITERNHIIIITYSRSCITVTWCSGPGGIQTLSARPTGFLQCFDTVGLVM